ncbi:hypothetical protein PSTG_08087 [Puccinia striiformis f. sp. tritici PST-78]|uniref:Uncharacterized protein n=1 Tax=Puccinia striiformis f. sp. tritici PST-78 TaxID=1165861 RepID=A0A0L0VHI9_9BASI|nr:hypothetical protein PSTG_08087 [Puccinia striiformis f. sp. tritici PST-78]
MFCCNSRCDLISINPLYPSAHHQPCHQHAIGPYSAPPLALQGPHLALNRIPNPAKAAHKHLAKTNQDKVTEPIAQPLANEVELEKARDTALNGVSKAYLLYGQPKLSDHIDKCGRPMIAYPCKMCPKKISRLTLDSSCSNLNKHAAICIGKKNHGETTQSLAALGITDTGLIDPKEVPQLCAVWCAEAAQPFSALVDASHKAILHPTGIKYLLTWKAVSKDIHKLYSAIQEQYWNELQAHKGALYLGADVWQSPNGVDILGVVIY